MPTFAITTSQVYSFLVRHVLPPALIVAIQISVGYLTHGFIFSNASGIRWAAITVSVAPTLLAFALLRSVFSALFASVVVIFTLAVVYAASTEKLHVTQIPLSWSDVTALENYLIIAQYVPPHIMILGGAVSTLLLVALLKMRYPRTAKSSRILYLLTAAMLSMIVFNKHLATTFPVQSRVVADWMQSHDIYYASWDWQRDAEQVGLPMHLVHTSLRRLLPVPTEQQTSGYTQLLQVDNPSTPRPRQFILVLCESC